MTPEKRRSFLSMLFVGSMDNFGLGVIFVMFAPLLLSPQYHFLPTDTSLLTRNIYLGILFASYPFTQLFGAPILGDIADQIGRKKALYISIAGVIFGFILSAIASHFSNLFLLIFSRLFTGFFAGNLSICLSAIADLSPSEKVRSRNFGILMVVWALSWTLATVMGAYLSDPTQSRFFSPALPFWLTAFITLLSLFAVAKFYTETHVVKGKPKLDLSKGLHHIHLSLKIKAIRPFFVILIAWTIGWGLSVQWFAAFNLLRYKITSETISWWYVLQAITWLIGGSVVNPLLLKKFKSLPIALIGYIGCTFFLLLSSFSDSYLLFNIFYSISALFSSFAFSNTMNLASIHASEDMQGKIMGLSQSMMSLGWVIVPIIGGYVGGTNINYFYPISTVLIGVALLLLSIVFLKNRLQIKK